MIQPICPLAAAAAEKCNAKRLVWLVEPNAGHIINLDLPISPLQHAEKCNAERLVLVGGEEWARGNVSVRDLAKREQKEVAADSLT